MITELLKQSPPHLDGELQETFDGVFHTVVNSGVTKLKPHTKLAPLLGYEGERDLKKRQKYSSLLEDMRVVSAWRELQFSSSAFVSHQLTVDRCYMYMYVPLYFFCF